MKQQVGIKKKNENTHPLIPSIKRGWGGVIKVFLSENINGCSSMSHRPLLPVNSLTIKASGL